VHHVTLPFGVYPAFPWPSSHTLRNLAISIYNKEKRYFSPWPEDIYFKIFISFYPFSPA